MDEFLQKYDIIYKMSNREKTKNFNKPISNKKWKG